ncbi:EamA family transporter [Bacteroidota bacterium]
MNQLIVLSIVVFATFIGAFGSLYLKKGSADLHRHFWKNLHNNHKLILGIFLFGVSSIFYVWALKFAELSLVYPVTSLSYVWISFMSIKFLGEKMNNYKWLGIIFIIVGVFLITR